MIIVVLVVLGLSFGSFVNALVWRLREQEVIGDELQTLQAKKVSNVTSAKIEVLKAQLHDRSISTGRSMCVDCKHTLAWYDLIPILSWLSIGGKCRYCHLLISWQYPVVELATAVLFIFSYSYWPQVFSGQGSFDFGVWLVALVGFMALAVYDQRWMILPNKIVYPLIALAGLQRVVDGFYFHNGLHGFVNATLAALIGGGIFFVLYQLSDGNWIGGGDVKLGYALGFFVGGPVAALLLLLLASVFGLIGAVPTMLEGRFKRTLQIPFGPCLLLACMLLVLFGKAIIHSYMNLLLV